MIVTILRMITILVMVTIIRDGECMIVIIKQGLSRNRLPDIVKDEVDQYERKIISAFSGKFCGPHQHNFPSEMKIKECSLALSWNHGKLKFAFETNESSQGEREEENLIIKSGVNTNLGNLVKDQFMLSGRDVSIHDFRIDVTRELLSLHGSCTSIINDGVFPLQILFYFLIRSNHSPQQLIGVVKVMECPGVTKAFIFQEFV